MQIISQHQGTPRTPLLNFAGTKVDLHTGPRVGGSRDFIPPTPGPGSLRTTVAVLAGAMAAHIDIDLAQVRCQPHQCLAQGRRRRRGRTRSALNPAPPPPTRATQQRQPTERRPARPTARPRTGGTGRKTPHRKALRRSPAMASPAAGRTARGQVWDPINQDTGASRREVDQPSPL